MVEFPLRGISYLPIIVKGLGDCENVKTKYAFRPQQYVSNTQVPAKILKAKITVKKESRSEWLIAKIFEPRILLLQETKKKPRQQKLTK